MILRPYQQEIAKAVLDSVLNDRGMTFSVEMARQGGKNEVSAQLELLLMTIFMANGGHIVKCSPTFKPQTIISMTRLREKFNEFGFDHIFSSERGYILTLGNCQTIFLSADESSSVLGHTADILLEIDESQDVSKEKYNKDFRPMASAFNATTVHYGTTWDDLTLLQEIKETNLELEKRDSRKRHFRYDWEEVGKVNPAYGSFVKGEKERLGESHPLFRTQYLLLPLKTGGHLLTRQQLVLMMGNYPRLEGPEDKMVYIAGIDLAGEQEQTKEEALVSNIPKRDATVISVAQIDLTQQTEFLQPEPKVKVVELYSWTGIAHSQVYPQMIEMLKKWNCHRVVVDATGIGEPIASFLRKELGSKVLPFTFTQKSKSDLGFELLALVNSGRLQLFAQDGSREYNEMMFELEMARTQYRPNQTMNFFVDPQDGHDDVLISLALLAEGAKGFSPRAAKGGIRND